MVGIIKCLPPTGPSVPNLQRYGLNSLELYQVIALTVQAPVATLLAKLVHVIMELVI
jgi:hypothetical protein